VRSDAVLTKPGSREELPDEVHKAIAEVKAHGFGEVVIVIHQGHIEKVRPMPDIRVKARG